MNVPHSWTSKIFLLNPKRPAFGPGLGSPSASKNEPAIAFQSISSTRKLRNERKICKRLDMGASFRRTAIKPRPAEVFL